MPPTEDQETLQDLEKEFNQKPGQQPRIKVGTQASSKPIELAKPDEDFVPLQGGGAENPLSLLPKGPALNQTPGDPMSHLMNVLRPFISGLAGTGAGIMGGGLPGGIAAYGAADVAQKKLNPVYNEDNLGETLSDSAKEALINEVGGRIFQGIGAGVKTLRNAGMPEIYKLYPKSSAALENFGYNNLASGARILEDFGAPKASIDALNKSGGAGFFEALKLSNLMNNQGRFTRNLVQSPDDLHKKILATLEKGITPGASPGVFQSNTHYVSKDAHDLLAGANGPFQALDDVIADKTKLQKVLMVGQSVGPKSLNVRKDLQAYYWNRIFDEATVHGAPGQATIDPKKIQELWSNPKLTANLETLYGRQTKENLDTFMNNVISTQQQPMKIPGLGNLKYVGGGFAAGGLLGGLLNASALSHAGGVMTALYIPTAVMGKLLTNPNVGRFLTAARGAEPLGQGGKLLSRGIFNALEGSRVAVMDDKNQKTWGTITRQPDSSFTLLPDQ